MDKYSTTCLNSRIYAGGPEMPTYSDGIFIFLHGQKQRWTLAWEEMCGAKLSSVANLTNSQQVKKR